MKVGELRELIRDADNNLQVNIMVDDDKLRDCSRMIESFLITKSTDSSIEGLYLKLL